MNRTVLMISLALLCLHTATCSNAETIALGEWQFVGNGFVADVDDALLVSEYPGSMGVMLISPTAYDCGVALQFDVLPLNPESVLVVMLASTDAGAGSTLSLPDNYDGNVNHLLNNVDAYFFAFHNAAHKRTPFVRRHPFIRGVSTDLDAAEKSLMSTKWHSVAASCDGKGQLRLTIDGAVILEATDPNPLEQGYLVFRLRGTSTHVASALVRGVEVTNFDSE